MSSAVLCRAWLVLVASVLSGAVFATAPATPTPHGTPATSPALVANSVTSERQALMLLRRWGIDDVHVRSTASGSVVRFSYRVLDADKAHILNDAKTEPFLIVKKTGARLQVPTTEKVGKLRQVAPPENGREYWMVFTNVGRMLKPGDHVEIVIGTFRADELVVESARPGSPAQTH